MSATECACKTLRASSCRAVTLDGGTVTLNMAAPRSDMAACRCACEGCTTTRRIFGARPHSDAHAVALAVGGPLRMTPTARRAS